MKKLIVIAITSTLFACQMQPAMATERASAESLYVALTSQTPEAIASAGYVIGVHDATYGLMHCTPNDLTIKDIITEVITFLRSIPANVRATASGDAAVVTYLNKKYPCV